MPINCSACILTYNSEKTLGRCLESVKDFFDIVILDGGSTDRTQEIARGYGARIYPQRDDDVSGKIYNFTAARKKLFSLALTDWVLWLDSDEWLSPEAREEVKKITKDETSNILHAFLRKAVINEKIINYAYFYPEYCKRLFNRKSDVSLKVGKLVHEDLATGPHSSALRHSSVIYHSWQESYGELLKKDDYYISLAIQGKSKSILPKKLRIAAINILKAIKVAVASSDIFRRYGFSHSLPPLLVWRFIRYHLKYAYKVLCA